MKRFLFLAVVTFFLGAADASGQPALAEISTITPVSLSIEMNPDGSRSLSIGLSGAKAGNFEQVIDAEKAARKSMEYFFTCLCLPDDKFWVNLNPGESDSVIDLELSRTDFGKILLAADLRLKKDTSELTNPRTPTGRQYWERLYRKAGELGITDSIPVSNRVWVVPGEIGISAANGKASIVKSELRVMVQAENSASVDPRIKELFEYSGRLMQEMLAPELQKKVNEHYAYWELRHLFRLMLLARWYKTVSGQPEMAKENLAQLDAEYAYGAEDIYGDYLDSLKNGEYSVSETRPDKLNLFLHLITRNYVSGGIDFRQTRWRNDPAAAEPEHAGSLRLSCTFALLDKEAQSLLSAKRSLQIVFPWSRLPPDLFRRLPAMIRFGKQVEESFSGKVFLNHL